MVDFLSIIVITENLGYFYIWCINNIQLLSKLLDLVTKIFLLVFVRNFYTFLFRFILFVIRSLIVTVKITGRVCYFCIIGYKGMNNEKI